jgi:hypothetical protein
MVAPPATLTTTIAQLAEKIRRYRDRVIGEQNTKASLIEPLLECLGWDIRDLDSVQREYRNKSRDNPVDYALKLLRRPRLFIEAKSLGENLSDRKWISQVLGYAAVAGVEWCVLTDGNEYRIYNATAAVDAEEKLFRKVCVADEDAAVVASTLHLISRCNLEENLLDVHWKTHFVDRRCKAAMAEMIDSADPGLVRLIRKKVPGLKAKAIAESLARLDVEISVPPMPIGPDAPKSARATRDQRGETISHVTRETSHKNDSQDGRAYSGITLTQLIEAGFLKAPHALFRKYKGRQMEATLLTDGNIKFGGKTFDSCSQAAQQARSTVTGRQMNTNGWRFWQYEDDGVKRELAYARQRFLDTKK